MPVPLRTTYHKAEAKYNVTTDFPSLGLHSAAATGNVGLVEYALDHGQPVNSVLDGVLPLHAACAGGNVQVVKLLIDHGADVNAPRLPRKYSNDRNRDSSAPIVGTSGSTPLHFAAANGNTDAITLLLLHGAHSDLSDKHGVTPEMLAEQNGWVESANALKEWILNKDRDLREREGYDTLIVSSGSGKATRDQISPKHPEPSSPPLRRRLHVKQSIDTALNMLKSPDPHTKPTPAFHTSTPPASPLKAFGEYSFYPIEPSTTLPIDPGARRPSLPHILQLSPEDGSQNRKPSPASTPNDSKQRRPRSAGTNADRGTEATVHPVYGRGGCGRKLGSKYSLLNIFKKAQHGEDTLGPSSDSPLARDSPGASSAILPLSSAPSWSKQPGDIDLNESADLPSSAGSNSPIPRPGSRFHRGSDASTKGVRLPSSTQSPTSPTPSLLHKLSGHLQTPQRTNIPLAMELHLALAQQQNRGRSNSSQPLIVGEDDDKVKSSSPLARLLQLPAQNRNRSASSETMPVESHDAVPIPAGPNVDVESEKFSSSPRPGILRAHNRTSSSGQGGSPLPSRTLRFDSVSSLTQSDRKPRTGESPRSITMPLRSHNSASSLTKLPMQSNNEIQRSEKVSGVRDLYAADDTEDHEENYGQPLSSLNVSAPLNASSLLLQRQRGLSFASSSESSLSPILSNENNGQAGILNAEFPFSIDHVPSPRQDEAIPRQVERLDVPTDGRGRGDSLSSEGTSDSRSNPQLSSSFTSGTGTLALSTPGLDSILALPQDGDKVKLDSMVSEHDLEPSSAPLNERRARPLDIDLSSISSHAQAEALVQRARQEVLDLANAQELSPVTISPGRSPLSARLAAYGESLALERKLREQKQSEENYWKDPAHNDAAALLSLSPEHPTPPLVTLPFQRNREGVERQLSLENKSSSPRTKRRIKDPRRPSTTEGISSSQPDLFSDLGWTSRVTGSASASNKSPVPAQDDLHLPPLMQMGNPLKDLPPPPSVTTSPTRDTPPTQSLSRISSFDGGDTEIDSVPPSPHIPTPPSMRGKREQVRSAKKLTRMGYPATEQASRPQPSSTPPASKRFGLRSLMQTFKGKA